MADDEAQALASRAAHAAGKAAGAPVSLHQRILGDIEQRIFGGQWPPGHRIPSEHELTAQYQCSRMTVNKVLTQLAHAGLIERRRKAGSFVMSTQSRSAVLEIRDIRSEVEALALPYRFEMLDRKKRRSLRADAGLLDMSEPGAVLQLETLHHAGARPFCLEQRLINLALAPAAADEPFDDVAPGRWLVDHVPWTTAEHRIRAASAQAALAPLLKVRRGTACLIVERRTWIAGKAVTFVRLTYPGESHELIARFSPTSTGHGGSADA